MDFNNVDSIVWILKCRLHSGSSKIERSNRIFPGDFIYQFAS